MTAEIEREFSLARAQSSRAALFYIQRAYVEGWRVGTRDVRSVIPPEARNLEPDPFRTRFLAQYSFAAIRDVEHVGQDRLPDVFERANQDATMSLRDVSNALRSEFLEDVAEYRIPIIARTETNRAGNAAKTDRYLAAGVTRHEALTAEDGRVRTFDTSPADHRAINGQVRVIGEAFSVPRIRGGRNDNGDRYPPFDPNCRCTVIPVIPETAGLAQLADGSRLRAWHAAMAPIEIAMTRALLAPWRHAMNQTERIIRTRGPEALEATS